MNKTYPLLVGAVALVAGCGSARPTALHSQRTNLPASNVSADSRETTTTTQPPATSAPTTKAPVGFALEAAGYTLRQISTPLAAPDQCCYARTELYERADGASIRVDADKTLGKFQSRTDVDGSVIGDPTAEKALLAYDSGNQVVVVDGAASSAEAGSLADQAAKLLQGGANAAALKIDGFSAVADPIKPGDARHALIMLSYTAANTGVDDVLYFTRLDDPENLIDFANLVTEAWTTTHAGTRIMISTDNVNRHPTIAWVAGGYLIQLDARDKRDVASGLDLVDHVSALDESGWNDLVAGQNAELLKGPIDVSIQAGAYSYDHHDGTNPAICQRSAAEANCEPVELSGIAIARFTTPNGWLLSGYKGLSGAAGAFPSEVDVTIDDAAVKWTCDDAGVCMFATSIDSSSRTVHLVATTQDDGGTTTLQDTDVAAPSS